MKPCEICGGSRQITLPLRQQITVEFEESPPAAPRLISRTYPCPECGGYVPEARLAFVTRVSAIEIADPVYRLSVRRSAAAALAKELLQSGFIQFSNIATDTPGELAERASVAVASPAHVASLEERVAAHQYGKARELAEKASRRIRQWGSDYTGDEGRLTKGQAIAMINEALARMIKDGDFSLTKSAA